MPHLAAFTHVSSAYANINLPMGATAEESVYPLRFGDREVDHADQVSLTKGSLRDIIGGVIRPGPYYCCIQPAPRPVAGGSSAEQPPTMLLCSQ